MGGRIHALALQLTGKTTLDECSVEELQHITNRHPYFAPAQFLLLQKLRQSGSTQEADKQYQKSVLFFHDPLQFEHFISSDKFLVEEETSISLVSQPEEADQTSNIQEEQLSVSPATDNGIDEIIVETSDQDKSFVDHAVDESDENSLQHEATNQLIEPFISDDEDKDSDQLEEEQELKTTVDVSEDTVQPGPEVQEIAEPLSTLSDGNIHDATVAETEIQTTNVNSEEHTPALSHSSSPSVNAPTDLTFEPFHTVDYFASQGIKISQEELPKDKLGKQLKSFTEWLKTMKRLPAVQMEQSVETSAEKKVESMASHSVTESDVVTEAMAEVWTKQGNKEKALDIYNKLSLLNPSKKAYFAAKIENLKLS